MGQVTSPDGRVMYVPDDMNWGAPPPLPALPDPLAGAMPSGLPTPPPPMPDATTALAPPPVSPFQSQLPTSVLDRIGVPRVAVPEPNAEIAAMGQGGATGAATGARISGDKGFQKKEGQRIAKQAAFDASPEGKIQAGQKSQQQAIDEQAQVAIAAGDVAAEEADATAALLEERNAATQGQRAELERAEAERATGIENKRVEYDKAIDAEANHKVDPGRKWASLSTGSKILAGISLALSVFAESQGSTKGNLAWDVITGAIKDDIAQQVQDREQLGRTIDRKKNSLDAYRQMTGDMREAANLKIAEEYKRTADQLEATAAKYQNPKAKLNAMNTAAQLRQSAGALSAQSAEGGFNRSMQLESARNARAQVGLGYARMKEDKRQFDLNDTRQNRALLIEAAKLDQAGNAAGAKAAREEAAINNELGIRAPAAVEMTTGADGQQTPVLDANGTPKISRSNMLMNADGTAWRAPDKETRGKLGVKMAAAAELADLYDTALAIRDSSGGSLSIGNSDAFTELKQIEARMLALQKSGTQGMSSDEDMKVLKDALGASDLNSFRARAHGLEFGRKRTISQLNTEMKFLGNYSGEPIEFQSSRAKGAAENAADQEFKTAVDPGESAFDPLTSGRKWAASVKGEAYVPGQTEKILGDKKRILESNASEQEKIKARTFLRKLATESTNAEVRRQAATIGDVDTISSGIFPKGK